MRNSLSAGLEGTGVYMSTILESSLTTAKKPMSSERAEGSGNYFSLLTEIDEGYLEWKTGGFGAG